MENEHRKKVLSRLKNIEGHIRGIERMVADDTYCIDVVRQTLAVQRALDKVNALIMQNHLQECVTTAIQSADEKRRQQVINEIVEVFGMSKKV
jgi:CsoR family transcriptional regulator, copper-sensing transcriptional repressor